VTQEQRIAAERIKTILTMLMAQDGQKALATDTGLGSDRITRSRHAIEVMALVLAARGYDVLSAAESRLVDDIRTQRLQAIVLQQAEQLQELRERLAELEGVQL
jgi:hypothetical protein